MKKLILAFTIFLFSAGASIEAASLDCCKENLDCCKVEVNSDDKNKKSKKVKQKDCCKKNEVKAASCHSDGDVKVKEDAESKTTEGEAKSEKKACCAKKQ